MAVDSSAEFGEDFGDPDSQDQQVRQQRERPITDKLMFGSAKIAGKGALLAGRGLAKGAVGTSKFLWEHKRDVGMAAGGAVTAVAAMNPTETADITKNVVGEGIHRAARVLNHQGEMPSQVEFNKSVTVDSEFGKITLEQKQLVDIAIAKEKANLDSVMTDEDWANVLKYENLVRETARKYKIDEKKFLEMVIIESHGDPFAESGAGAAGLAQELPEFAEHFGKKVVHDDDPNIAGLDKDLDKDKIRQYRIENDQRYNPVENLDAAAQSIAGNMDKFRDDLIAYQVHHDGDRRVFGAIRKFVYDRYGYMLADVLDVNIGDDTEAGRDANTSEAMRRLRLYQEAIEGRSLVADAQWRPITILDLISTGEFTGDGTDYGDRYIYLMSAAGQLFDEKKAGLARIAAEN